MTLTANQAQPIQDRISSVTEKIISKLVSELGWEAVEGEDDQRSCLRAVIFGLSEAVGNKEVAAEAIRRFENSEKILPDLKPLVYKIVAKSSQENWEKVLAICQKTDLHDDKLRIAKAMAVVTGCDDEERIKRYYDWMTYSGDIGVQDMYIAFVAGGAGNPEFAANYLMDNWKRYHDAYGSTFTFIFTKIFDGAIAWVHSKEQLERLEKFFGEQEGIETIQVILDKTYENIRK